MHRTGDECKRNRAPSRCGLHALSRGGKAFESPGAGVSVVNVDNSRPPILPRPANAKDERVVACRHDAAPVALAAGNGSLRPRVGRDAPKVHVDDSGGTGPQKENSVSSQGSCGEEYG